MIYIICGIILLFVTGRLMAARPDLSLDKLSELLNEGAVLVDVRSAGEFISGHSAGSVNIPVDSLPEGLTKHGLSADSILLLCCAGGSRSAHAKKVLLKAGYKSVYNAGSVTRLTAHLRKTAEFQ